MLSGAVCLSCTNERQQFQPEATPDRKSAIIGENDTVTSIQVASADKDTVIYDTPECYLWYVEDLPESMIRRSAIFGMSKTCRTSTRTNLFPCGRNVLFIGRMYKPLMCS